VKSGSGVSLRPLLCRQVSLHTQQPQHCRQPKRLDHNMHNLIHDLDNTIKAFPVVQPLQHTHNIRTVVLTLNHNVHRHMTCLTILSRSRKFRIRGRSSIRLILYALILLKLRLRNLVVHPAETNVPIVKSVHSAELRDCEALGGHVHTLADG
jgi:hypothetical protein